MPGPDPTADACPWNRWKYDCPPPPTDRPVKQLVQTVQIRPLEPGIEVERFPTGHIILKQHLFRQKANGFAHHIKR